MVLFIVEFLFEFGRFFDIVVNFENKFLGDGVLISQFPKNLKLFASILILSSNITNNGSDSIDIIRHDNAAKSFQKDDTDSFHIVNSTDISKADSEHNIRSPVKRPYILFEPRDIHDTFFDDPVVRRTEVGHGCEEKSYDVGVTKIYQEDFGQLPVLLVVYVADEVYLDLLDLLEALRQLEYYEHTDVSCKSLLGCHVD